MSGEPPNQPPGYGGAFGPPQDPQQNAQQPQQNAWGQPQPQAWTPPAQPGAFGAQQPQAWAPPPQQGGFGAQPQAWGQQPQQAAWGQPQQPQGPPRQLGIFESVPCPHCGLAMSSNAGGGAYAGRVVGGLVGWMIITAIASKYYCGSHGEVSTDLLPPQHRSMVTMRRLLMAGGGLGILAFLFCVLSSFALSSRY